MSRVLRKNTIIFIKKIMGEAEIDHLYNTIFVTSHIITYGNASDEKVTSLIRDEIETMWNEPKGTVYVNNLPFLVTFNITSAWKPEMNMETVYTNTDPRNNYFRVEEYAKGNISFVDGMGCNSGYFKLENLYTGSTTAAHEYGHTLGLDHPADIDYRGKGVPGIMYPRGTLVDPQYQYDPSAAPGTNGGTIHPMYRRVLSTDITSLNWVKLEFKNKKAVVGEFTNVFHLKHG